MLIPFLTKKQGQIEFYDLLNKIDGTIPIYDDFTDGVVRGTILEFKLRINSIGLKLLQIISYSLKNLYPFIRSIYYGF